MANLTSRRLITQRGTDDSAPISPEKYATLIAVGRIEARFPRYHTQLERLDLLLGAFRSRIAQLEGERREVLARMDRQ